MALALITFLGLLLRLILSNQSFWLDESASIMAARVPLDHFFESLKADFHPPFYYLLLSAWVKVSGSSEWLIRLPGIIVGTLSVPAIYILCAKIFTKNSRVPLLASLFLAINPLHIYYSQELRMYSLAAFLCICSWVALVDKKYFTLSMFNLLGVFSFYGFGFNIAAQFVLFLLFKKKIGKFILSLLPTIFIFIIWWPIFAVQLSNGRFLTDALPGWQTLSGSVTLKSLLLIPIKFIIGRTNLQPQSVYFLTGGILLIVFSLISAFSVKNKKSIYLWTGLLVPLLLGVLISLKTPMLGYWRFIFILPFFTSILAVGVDSLPKKIRVPAILMVCITFLASNIVFWTDVSFHREDWRGLSNFVNGKKAIVVIPFPSLFAPLTFYTTDAKYVIAQTEFGVIRSDLQQKIQSEIGESNNSVFVLDYLADLTDPNREIMKIVAAQKLEQTEVYNFNNIGQVYEFKKL